MAHVDMPPGPPAVGWGPSAEVQATEEVAEMAWPHLLKL